MLFVGDFAVKNIHQAKALSSIPICDVPHGENICVE